MTRIKNLIDNDRDMFTHMLDKVEMKYESGLADTPFSASEDTCHGITIDVDDPWDMSPIKQTNVVVTFVFCAESGAFVTLNAERNPYEPG